MNDYYGFSEEEIQEISEYDEEWGHLKTKAYPDSMSSRELLERIQSDPVHESFYNHSKSSGILIMYSPIFLLILIFILYRGSVVLANLVESAIVLTVAVLAFLHLFVYFYNSEKSNSIIANSLGIGWKKYYVAIEWEHIEWVDIGTENGRIKRIEFSGNRRHIYHCNGQSCTEFTRDHLRRFLPYIDTWVASRIPDWPDNFSRYTRPMETDN